MIKTIQLPISQRNADLGDEKTLVIQALFYRWCKDSQLFKCQFYTPCG